MRKTAISLVAGIGVAADTLPLLVPWYIFITIFLLPIGFLLFARLHSKLAWLVLSSFVVLAALGSYIPSPLACAVLAFALLVAFGCRYLACIVLLLHLSAFATVQQLAADYLHKFGLEATAPSILAIALIAIVIHQPLWRIILTTVFSVLGAVIASVHFNLPELILLSASLPAIGLASASPSFDSTKSEGIPRMLLIVVAGACLCTWAWAWPRTSASLYVILPDAKEAPEKKYFDNYLYALRFAGLQAKEASRPEDIENGSFVMMPWLTAPFDSASGDPLATKIGQLARERKWTVMVAGEHTNLGGCSARLAIMAGRSFLRDDLTVPRHNTDDSGPLHVASLFEWSHESILNRGASVRVTSPIDKILLSGDGWWAEPNIGEWLWVGDYKWSPKERAGRLTLALSSDVGGARWVVVGDNSPFLNELIIADPRPLVNLLQLSSLWPTLAMDCVISFLLCCALANMKARHVSIIVMAGAIAWIPLAIVQKITGPKSGPWKDSFIGENGFDDRNFNQVLANKPELIENRRLIRIKSTITGKLHLPDENSVIFMLVERGAEIEGVSLTKCRRIGALTVQEGPFLMDAQACTISGQADILIGTENSAVAFRLRESGTARIIVLDTAFLSKRAPTQNVEWLMKVLRP